MIYRGGGMEQKRISIITYDGYKGGERPGSFVLEGRTIHVAEIATMRIEEDRHDRLRRRYFQVKGSDGHVYTLVEDERTQAWYVQE